MMSQRSVLASVLVQKTQTYTTVSISRYDPQSAFELTLQWSVATGSIITDLIHGWARKSQQSGFSLIPVPHDPFALPITKNSDPVRGPIFVELVNFHSGDPNNGQVL